MPFDIHSLNLPPEKVDIINQALEILNSTLMPLMVNITPEEKQKKYNTPYRDEVPWIEKIQMYMKDLPELTPHYIDTEEFKKDFQNYLLLQEFAKAIVMLKEGVDDTSMVLWTDIFNVARTYFEVIKLASKNDVPGSTSIYNDLKVIFEDRGRKVKGTKNEDQKGKNSPPDEKNTLKNN